ncbi:cytochrome P450 [Roseobacter sp. YSTF-M11]|uniref:Cytochrome P450 n=1 Tax=Roseobacter insulae TaxID=2859783 RepID=A0A9X1K310_9RHOB|nr:cytochrome P450 [Roseobacter insulae]MBW4708147.1 cytochrome P450 [Roseobacter insulae]
MTRPPKPESRSRKVPLWRYARLFRRDIISAQPEHLYGAWMAEFRTPFFHSFMANDPTLIKLLLKDRPDDFPKSDRVGEGLRPLLGNSVFLTNGETWKRQRRIIDPAFEGGRLRETFPAMWDAAQAMAERIAALEGQEIDVEPEASHAAADVIFRTLFSIPIEHRIAREVYDAFQTYQRSQPILNLAAFLPLPRWMPRGFRRSTKRSAARIRGLILHLTRERQAQIDAGNAPQDLATKIMTTPDPITGDIFGVDEMVDQVAIFFLAGHETSASSLAWALYLLALYPDWQDRVAAEAQTVDKCDFGVLSNLRVTRDVFRETLRLYPPVPMMVRETVKPETLRKRTARRGAQLVLSQWHLHRHNRLWHRPDDFDPARWQTESGQASAKAAYVPFSAGPRVCPGAGFAMIEGVLMLAHILRDFRVVLTDYPPPVPVAHLTVRSRDGIWLRIVRR